MVGRLLVCTDLDRTLIPNGAAPESPGARDRFAMLAEHEAVVLAFVSGRDRDRVAQAIDEFSLPTPDFVIGDVGTTIYIVDSGSDWRPEAHWEASISADWAGHDGRALAHHVGDVDGLRLQERDRQGPHKLSYYADLAREPGTVIAPVEERLAELGVDARLVWSIDEAKGVGLLDVLPASASKYHAIRALMDIEGFGLDDTVFCGDSGNDMEVLVSPLSAVLVANADPDVVRDAESGSSKAGLSERLYLARGGFMGMNGNYAGGMLEGIAHFHPHIVSWIDEGEATT